MSEFYYCMTKKSLNLHLAFIITSSHIRRAYHKNTIAFKSKSLYHAVTWVAS